MELFTAWLIAGFTTLVAMPMVAGKPGSGIRSQLLFKKWAEIRPGNSMEKHHLIQEGTGCQCVNDNCGCCVHMESETLHLNDTGCVNITYLPDQYGFSLTFSLDGKILLNETLSAKNPPPICVKLPYVKEVSLCIDFYNLDVSNNTFSGCVKIEARLLSIFSEDWDIGCFRIPFKPKILMADPSSQQMQQMQWAEFEKQHKMKYLKLRIV